MKAKVTGVTAWQGTPTGGTLSIRAPRYVDSSGNASPEEYSAVLDVNQTPPRWMDALDPTRELYVIVQGPDDLPGVRARFYEVLHYGPTKSVRTEFTRKLISSDLNGLIFDYAMPEPTDIPVGFGDAPLTMRAAQQVIEEGGAVVSEWSDIKVDIAQQQATLTQLANLKQAASVAAIPATAGLYIITAGAEAGQVHERISGGGTVPRPELEGLGRMAEQAARAAHRRYRAGDYQIGPQYTAAQNAARINALAAQIGAAFTLEIPGGVTQFDSTLNLPYYVHFVGSNGFMATAGGTQTPMLQYTGSGVAIIAAGSLQLTDITICAVRPGTTESGSIFRAGTVGVRTAGNIQWRNAYLYGFGINLDLQQGGYYSQWIGGENGNADMLAQVNDAHNLTVFKVAHRRYNKGWRFLNSANPVTYIGCSFEMFTDYSVYDAGSSQFNFESCYVENYPTTAIAAGLTSSTGFYDAFQLLTTGRVTVAGKYSSVRFTNCFASCRGVTRFVNAAAGTLASLVSTGNKFYKDDGSSSTFIYRVDTILHGLFADDRDLPDGTNYVNAAIRVAAGVLMIEPGVDVFASLVKLTGSTMSGPLNAPSFGATAGGAPTDGAALPSVYRSGLTFATISGGTNWPGAATGANGMSLTVIQAGARGWQLYAPNGGELYYRTRTAGADSWQDWRPLSQRELHLEAMGAITARTLNMRVIPTPTVYTRLLGVLGTASSSGSVVAEIRVNGVWKARLTWAQGTTTAPAITYASGSGFSIAAGDTLTVVATSAGTGAADVAITCAAAL